MLSSAKTIQMFFLLLFASISQYLSLLVMYLSSPSKRLPGIISSASGFAILRCIAGKARCIVWTGNESMPCLYILQSANVPFTFENLVSAHVTFT